MMPPTKPVEVAVVRKNLDPLSGEEVWEPYQEYGVKTLASTKDWSCYILAKERELFGVRCTNMTEKLLAVRISVDACHIQQYLLRPNGKEGDTVICNGTGEHAMTFHPVSALSRVGSKHSRLPSETGCINVTVFRPLVTQGGLPPPDKPTEHLELPVSMDGTFWKLCVRLTGVEPIIGQPSPHSAEISTLGWKQFTSVDFNYRTEEELFSGRIRGIEALQRQKTAHDVGVVSPVKRKREPTGDDIPQKRRDQRPPWTTSEMCTPPTARVYNPAPSSSCQSEQSPSPTPIRDARKHFPSSVPGPLDHTPPASPNVSDDAPQPTRQPSPPQPQPSIVAPAITPPPTPRNNSEPQKSTAGDTDRATQEVPTLASFLDEVSDKRSLRFLEKGLRSVGIITLTQLKVVARQPEEFRAKISVLADLRERDQYLWMKLKKKLLDHWGGGVEQPADSLIENDPVRRFIHSLGVEECLNTEWLAESLRGSGITTQNDLLVLSRNSEKYMEHIPFLRAFAASNRFGWVVFRIGLEGLPGRRKTPTFIQTQDHGAGIEGHAFIKGFLDNIDSDKPLGYLADGFVKAGLTARYTLLDVAEDIKFAIGAMPFLQNLASGDQMVWAMISVGLEKLQEHR